MNHKFLELSLVEQLKFIIVNEDDISLTDRYHGDTVSPRNGDQTRGSML